MTFVTRAPFSAFWSEAALAGVSANRFFRPLPRVLLIAAGLIAGATLSFTLTEFKSEAGKPSAIPSDREAAPQRPRNQRPYVPRIRIGLLSSISNSGASRALTRFRRGCGGMEIGRDPDHLLSICTVEELDRHEQG